MDLSFPSKWILHNDNVVVIADKFPKAKFHYLVLPKAVIPSIFDVSGLFKRWILPEAYLNFYNLIHTVDAKTFGPVGRNVFDGYGHYQEKQTQIASIQNWLSR